MCTPTNVVQPRLVDHTVISRPHFLRCTDLTDVVRALGHASHLNGCQLRHATALCGVVGSFSLASLVQRWFHHQMQSKLDWSIALGLVDLTVLRCTALADGDRAGLHASHMRGCLLRHAAPLLVV